MPPESPQIQRLKADIRKLELMMNEHGSGITKLGATVSGINSAVTALQQNVVRLPTSPVSNLLWNGELGHSVNSWHDAAYVVADKARECAWFFSTYRPFSAVSFTTITTNNQIPWPSTQPLPENGTPIQLRNTGGGLPTGGGSPIAANTTYYTVVAGGTAIGLASTEALGIAGTADKTWNAGTGTGTHRIEQFLDATDGRTSSTNKTLKASSHSTYSALFAAWDSARGEARLYGTRTIDTILPANLVDATLGNLYTSFILAKRNQYIDIPEACLMGVGVWDATSGQGDWLRGSIGFDAVATIDGATTLERRYRMYVVTDRGYTMLSDEIVVANAPDDGQYDLDNFVSLSWRPVPGYLRVELYVYTPSTGVYRLLAETSSGASTYIDNGAVLDVVAGYPAADETERKAIFYSRTGELRDVDVDGTPWLTFFAPIGIPDNYDKALTTGRQWLRIFQTVACDLVVSGITTDGTADIVSTIAGVFEDEFDAEFDNLAIFVYDENGVELADTNISNRIDTETLTLDTTIAAGTNRSIRIIGGGFHGMLIDKIHAGYQRNVSFANNPLDVRILQPVAAPSGSSQGGPGGGDGGDGGVICVTDDTPIQLSTGDETYSSIDAGYIERGYNVEGEMLEPNVVESAIRGFSRTRVVRTKNGFEKECTSSHRFRMTKWDQRGTSLSLLKVGDPVYTNLSGRDELSPLVYIGPLSKERKAVTTPRLGGPGHYYRAGRWKPNWWQRLLIRLKLMKPKTGGIYAHNRKREGELLDQ